MGFEVLVQLAEQFRDLLHNDEDVSTKDLIRCGPVILSTLTQSVIHIKTRLYVQSQAGGRPSASGPQDSRLKAQLETLLALSNDYINSVDFHSVQSHWLRLHTDSSIVLSLLDIATGVPVGEAGYTRFYWLDIVRRLDLAIIVSGAVGTDRSKWVHTLIRQAQDLGLPRLGPLSESPAQSASLDVRPSKRMRLSPSSQSGPGKLDLVIPSLFARSPITELSPPPSMTSYTKTYSTTPFVVRGYLNDESDTAATPPWPAMRYWASASYLLDQVGEGRVVPVELGGAYVDTDWGQRIIPFRQFLSRAGYDDIQAEPQEATSPGCKGQNDEPIPDLPLYLAQHTLFRQFPQLEKEFSLPDYVWSEPPEPQNLDESLRLAKYQPVPDGPSINVWIGNSASGIVSPAHTVKDPHFNCYAQVLGKKRVWLAPPTSAPHMYAYGQSHEPDEQSDTEEDGSDLAEKYMTNTSKVPIFRSGNLSTDELRERYPDFFEHVWPEAQETILEPGDLLVMPPGWWHAMRGEGTGPGWSVSMWY